MKLPDNDSWLNKRESSVDSFDWVGFGSPRATFSEMSRFCYHATCFKLARCSWPILLILISRSHSLLLSWRIWSQILRVVQCFWPTITAMAISNKLCLWKLGKVIVDVYLLNISSEALVQWNSETLVVLPIRDTWRNHPFFLFCNHCLSRRISENGRRWIRWTS